MERRLKINSILVIVVACILVAGFVSYKIIARSNKYNTLNNASVLFADNKKDEAIKILEHMVSRKPNDIAALNKLSYFYFETKRFDELKKLITNNNLTGETIEGFLSQVAIYEGDDTQAEKILSDLTKTTKNQNYFISYATYFITKGNLPKALEVARQGITQTEAGAKLYIFASSVCIKMSDKTCAREYASAALTKDENNQQAKNILEAL